MHTTHPLLSGGDLCPGGLCSGGVSIQGDLCPGRSGVCVQGEWGFLSRLKCFALFFIENEDSIS